MTAAIAPPVSAAEFLQLVAKYLKALGDPAALHAQESNLFDLGLDSTAALSLLMEIEERYGVTFPDSLLSDSTFETAEALKRGLGVAVRDPRLSQRGSRLAPGDQIRARPGKHAISAAVFARRVAGHGRGLASARHGSHLHRHRLGTSRARALRHGAQESEVGADRLEHRIEPPARAHDAAHLRMSLQ